MTMFPEDPGSEPQFPSAILKITLFMIIVIGIVAFIAQVSR